LLSDLDPNVLGPGIAVGVIPLLYAFIGAAGFLIADIHCSFREPPLSPAAEGTEQAKAIVERVVEKERR
jgi:hypothetical protein